MPKKDKPTFLLELSDERKKKFFEDKSNRSWDRGDAEKFYLLNANEIEIHLIESEIVKGKLIEEGRYVYVLEVKGIQVLINKSAIKFIRILSNLFEG